MSSKKHDRLTQAARRTPHAGRVSKLRGGSLGAVLAIALSLVFAGAPAAAGDRGHGYRSGHGDYRTAVRHGYRYDNRRHRSAHRGYRHGYRDGYRHQSRHYRSHRRHHDNDAAYLIGGLVLGSVITHAVTNRYDRPRHYDRHYNRYSSREVVYVNQPQTVRSYSTSSPVVQGRRLYRDLDGNCFERLDDEGGNELLQELPASACDW